MTYKQRLEFAEDGFGEAVIWFTISDVYGDTVNLSGAVEVDVFDVDRTAEDVDVDTGVYAADEISFAILEDAAETAADSAAITFALAAQSPETPRFCSLIVNPVNPAAVADDEVAFRGQVQPSMSWDDRNWSGEEYDTDIDPIREWSCTAMSYDAQFLIDAKIGELLDDWKEADEAGYSAWHDSHVEDRLGWFYRLHGVDVYGHREARFANLVHFHTLVRKLLELATPAGFTIVFQPEIITNLRCVPARFNSQNVNGRRVRYSFTQFLSGTGSEPLAYRVHGAADSALLRLSFDPNADGELFVSWRLVRPLSDEEGLSWQDMSVLDLLYSVSTVLGMFVEFEYSSHSVIQIRFTERSAIEAGQVYIADATDSSGDTAPLSDAESGGYRGAVWRDLGEGRKMYIFDGNGFIYSATKKAIGTGKNLPLTIGPAYCFIPADRANDAGDDMNRQVALLAHNSIFYNGTERLPFEEHNLSAITTAMYIKKQGLADNYGGFSDGSVGCEFRATYPPVAYFWTEVDGVVKNYGSMMQWVGDILLHDTAYFETELQMTIPYLFGFRSTPSGSGDWRNLKRGSLVVVDAKEYLVVGIERRWRGLETVVRLHAKSRFAFSSVASGPVTEEGESSERAAIATSSEVKLFQAGEDIAADDAVTLRSDGKVYRARSSADDYSAIKGLALDPFDEELDVNDMIRVTVSGRHPLSTPTVLDPGTRLFVRTTPFGAWNVSHLPLTYKTASENLFYEIAVVDSGASLNVTHKKQHEFG
ncbi:MAG: hypothetical protein KDD67_13770 [Ignavibacteriae bacterium]|nr:hypothetical protein [Ignavibacteriota bacterium]MCB9216145.1 hypothetical protein [Ignavibacteria bacterium]